MRRVRSMVLAWSVLLPLAVHAYPITPHTLWDEVEQAELVVLARVGEVRELPRKGKDIRELNSHVARLQVLEAWKGRAENLIEVPYPKVLVCPAPPVYAPGEQVVAFLSKSSGTWATVALSYGTRYPEPDELADLREMVRHAVAAQARNGGEGDRIAWLVEAASRPATRWDGLYGLAPEGDRLHSYYDRRSKGRQVLHLSREQLARIAAAFVRNTPADRALPIALLVLQDYPDSAVDRAAVSAIETRLTDPSPPWWLRDAMFHAFARFGDPDPVRRAKALGEPFDDVAPEILRRAWKEARAVLNIPEAPMIPQPPPRFRVGPDTPS